MVFLNLSTIVLLIGVVLAAVSQYMGFSHFRKRRIITDTPTSKAKGVFMGLVEICGKVVRAGPLTSYLSESPCVYYSWSVHERWSRTVRETYRDAQRKTKTRTRRESGWTKVAGGGDFTVFDVCDDTGCVQIDPEGAKIHGEISLKKTCDRRDPLYFGKGPESEVRNSDHIRRFSETHIPVGASVYVIGQARERSDKVAPEIAWSSEAPIFLISTKSEKRTSSSHTVKYWSIMLLGLVALMISIWISGLVTHFGRASLALYIWFALLYVGVWFLGWFWIVYNGMKSLRERVRQATSLIDIQLRRRHDLVPRLVNIVRGTMEHETTVQERISAIRQELEQHPEETASVLKGLSEDYPVLKANEAYSSLQRELSCTEERISLARDYYNEIATFYNTRLEKFPDRIVARAASLESLPLITGDPDKDHMPDEE